MAAPGASRSASDNEAWWKSAVVYQIYVRSFADTDDDGIGDLPGIVEHLDYLQELGIDVIWLSPVYRSPQEDNGYDVSDYRDVDPLFGTLEDLDRLLAAVHLRGMRLIMDLVVNHTSDQHPWFLASRGSREAATAEWYFWRDARPGTVPGEPGSEPNNWGASFGGSAWEWVPERGQYYLHLFAPSQPDLNWDNPDTREAVFTMMDWWLDRGIDGFRMDVINFISKDPLLPDAPLTRDGYGDGMPYFSHGPQIHAYLAEMKRRVFDPRPGTYLTVGEMPGVTPEQARELTDQEHGHLNMVFQYEHVALDADGDKWTRRPMSVNDLRDTLARWQTALGDTGWNSLYWNNHDQPRVVSRYGNDTTYWRESATALATVLHLHRGTPYVYQGEEIGMTNAGFAGIDDFRDIESLDHYRTAVGKHREDPSVALDALRRQSRDNARTPMQWSAAPGAGFTTGSPWIGVNPNHSWLNVATQRGVRTSIYEFYRALIALRHRLPVVVDGSFAAIETGRDQIYAFRRHLGNAALTVNANLSDLPVSVDRDDRVDRDLVLANYPGSRRDPDRLEPWEVRVYLR